MAEKEKKVTKLSRTEKKLNFIDSYIRNKGNITKACQEVGISRMAFYKWMRETKFKEMFANAISQHNDVIYERIYSLAESGDKDMLKFWAKTQMKDWGFTEKQELEHSGEVAENKTLNVRFIGVEDVEGDKDEKQEHTN